MVYTAAWIKNPLNVCKSIMNSKKQPFKGLSFFLNLNQLTILETKGTLSVREVESGAFIPCNQINQLIELFLLLLGIARSNGTGDTGVAVIFENGIFNF
jgi:hypothetical protein